MVDLIFAEEPTRDQSRSWTVLDGEIGDLLGCVGWLDTLGVYGFGAVPGVAVFSDPAVMQRVGRFLDEVNREQ